MMSKILRLLVETIALFHNYIAYLITEKLGIADDKIMHFVVLGIAGMIMFLCIKPIFDYLSKNNKVVTITFIYVFTLMVVLTFAIEIGQRITNTGAMEFKDIVAGLAGFLFLFIIYLIIYFIIKHIKENKENLNN